MTRLTPVESYAGQGALFHLPSQGSKPPVLMTHGTFSNAETMSPIAQFLSDAGHPVYVIEWRGRDGRPPAFDFHDLAEDEISSAIAAIAKPVHLLGHSGGGVAMCFALLEEANREKALSLTKIAAQSTRLAEAPLKGYLPIRIMEVIGRYTGYWPSGPTGLGPCNDSAKYLSQWVAFNRARRVWCRDGSDLFPKLARVNVPVLALAGAGDHSIARPDGCKDLADAFGSTSQFHICSAETDGEDFTHSRIIRSRAAARSVWPRITEFLEETSAQSALSQRKNPA